MNYFPEKLNVRPFGQKSLTGDLKRTSGSNMETIGKQYGNNMGIIRACYCFSQYSRKRSTRERNFENTRFFALINLFLVDGLVGVVALWAKNSVSLQQYFADRISDVLKVTAIKQNALHRRSQSSGSLARPQSRASRASAKKEYT